MHNGHTRSGVIDCNSLSYSRMHFRIEVKIGPKGVVSMQVGGDWAEAYGVMSKNNGSTALNVLSPHPLLCNLGVSERLCGSSVISGQN